MRARKAEVDAIVRLLEAEHEDVYELASEVFSAVADMMRKREAWCVVVNDPGVGSTVWGTYESQSKAEKAIGKEVVASTIGSVGQIARLVKVGDLA